MSLDMQLAEILKKWITPVLKSHDFKKNRRIYIRELDELSWVIDVQRSQWNDVEELCFTLNCGIFIPKIMCIYANRPTGRTPRLEDCCIAGRIGMLSQGKDRWWSLSTHKDSATSIDEIGYDVTETIDKEVFPFFLDFRNCAEVITFLEDLKSDKYPYVFPRNKAQRLVFSAILYWLDGKKEQGYKLIEIAIGMSEKSPIKEVFLDVVEKLEAL